MSDLKMNLEEYARSNVYPFHMPGHKRRIAEGVNPFQYDITEIDGFDNLHNPQGILRIAMENAAKFYGTDATFFMVNGSTGGLLAAISSVTKVGDEILIARNCHKSVYHAVYLRELKQHYVVPDYIETYGICGGISAAALQRALAEHSKVKAVVITSPTYEGVVSDIAALAQITHGYQIPLIVDEAHGAHFGMHPDFPASAVSKGADLVIQSLHKTLPALTQSAVLHVKRREGIPLSVERLRSFLSIYQTSSPSYVLMAEMDRCVRNLKKGGPGLFESYVRRITAIGEHAKQFSHLRLVGREIVNRRSVYDFDLSKLVISVRGTHLTGQKLYDILNDNYELQLEMAAGDYAVAMTSYMDTEEGLLRLFTALAEIDRDLRLGGKTYEYQLPKDRELTEVEKAEQCFFVPDNMVLKSIAEAVEGAQEQLPIQRSVGRISSGYLYLYPPGVPVVAPGDFITKEVVALILHYEQSGLKVHGWDSEKDHKISVVKEAFQRLQF